MDRLEALRSIARDAASGELSFPTHTQLALKIKSALDDPNCSVDQAARLVQADPLLSARVVAMANSVAYNRSGREVADVKTAVNRLGFTTLRTLAMALVTRQMAGGTGSPAQQTVARQLWERTAHVAALARVLAQKVTGQNPESALFAGLVHDIGGFYLISRSVQYPSLLKVEAPLAVELADAAEGTDIDTDQRVERDLGLAVLRKLEVPAAVIEGIEDYWRGMLSLPPETLGDTLLLADVLAPVAHPLRWQDPAQPAATRAASIDMLVGEETLQEILRESAAEVGQLIETLKF
ncbi:HDOD domain-containing protein [Aquimonas voraii]|uniref:HD-like signal output (HDOD) domain, no enzymatic activity n=1 Tax=Aquimonas voraii TaxID=265719 RepID=A0A1G6U0E5_9GAMM|nr:HDOD domain-containing protein [Aquimonas voraii]SDD34015.1 HD-like signal output (HDOD) domain, no enzymatic activity [Aquimonas voraii]